MYVLESLFNKVAGLKACNFIKMRFQYRCFPVNFRKFLATPFSQNTSGRLLLTGVDLQSNYFEKICGKLF